MDPPRYLHVTISMPPGRRLETLQWKHVFRIAFRNLGLAVQRLPYFSWRHGDAENDHAAAMLTLRDFLGRDVILTGQGAGCDRADLEISEMLGLPRPHVPHYGRWPRAGLFHRRKKAGASDESAHALEVMDDCLRTGQPTDMGAFAAMLAPRLPLFGVEVKESTKEHQEIELRLPDSTRLGARAISNDLRPGALAKQFTLFQEVAALKKRYANWLLLFGNGSIFDHWLGKGRLPHAGEENILRGSAAGVPKNRGFSAGPHDEDRRGRGILLELHRLLETGEGGKAVLIERLFEEILAIRMQQSAMEAKLDEVLHQQRAMVEALNLPVASGR